MSSNPERSVIVVPPMMVEALSHLVAAYAEATGQPVDDVRRLVELGVLSRGMRTMLVEVDEQVKLTKRMGWA